MHVLHCMHCLLGRLEAQQPRAPADASLGIRQDPAGYQQPKRLHRAASFQAPSSLSERRSGYFLHGSSTERSLSEALKIQI